MYCAINFRRTRQIKTNEIQTNETTKIFWFTSLFSIQLYDAIVLREKQDECTSYDSVELFIDFFFFFTSYLYKVIL